MRPFEQTVQRLRGTHDIFGDDALQFQKIESTARKVFKNFGFSELRTPILEEKEVFTRALGTETDVVQKEMYEFEDRSRTRVAMRPEGTAGVVRAYLENEFDKTEGLAKFFYLGPMFRSERPQAGRLRQFHQIGVETLGADSPAADAETIHALTVFLDQAGAAGYHLRLNNLGTFEERDGFREILKNYFRPFESSLCEDCRVRLNKNVFRLLDCKIESCRRIAKDSPPISGHLGAESNAHFQRVCELLERVGVVFALDPFMVRGLDYYTKTVFEVSHPKLGAQDALGAGGRYDRLIESFGGPKLGAVGFAVGVERLVMCIGGEKKETASYQNTFFIATLGETAQREGFALLSDLRKAGLAALADFSSKSLKGQMRLADKWRCRFVMILGDNELRDKKFVLKNMEKGEQREYLLEELIETARSLNE